MSDVKHVLQAILELSEKMDQQYETLSGRIDDLNEKFDALSEKVDNNHQLLLDKIDQINEKIGLLAEDSVSTRADVRGLKKAIKMNS